jgi:phage shock protein C
MTESRLTRSEKDQIIAGVCGGLAEYLAIDVVLVRIAFVILAFASGIGIPIYLILWLIMPKETIYNAPNAKIFQDNIEEVSQKVSKASHSGTVGAILIILGIFFLLQQLGLIGWLSNIIWPLLIIGFGLYILNRR